MQCAAALQVVDAKAEVDKLLKKARATSTALRILCANRSDL